MDATVRGGGGGRVTAVAVAAAAVAAVAVVAAAGRRRRQRLCSTLRRDPETRGAMPRAGLRRHALAARLADRVLLSCNHKKPLKKLPKKSARLGPPQAKGRS